MEKRILKSTIGIAKMDEMSADEQRLISKAIEMTNHSYAKYSHFNVGAAVMLDDGSIVGGCNQENAAFGVTICAERNALFTAGNLYPDVKIEAIAIAARNAQGFLSHPISPCGSCRQVMIETETRHQHPLRIVLYGTEGIYVLEGIATLMPLSFNNME